MTVARKKIIAVLGGRDCTPEIAAIAERVGTLIAKNDAILVCGGHGGVMEAACKGAAAAGGLTIGILPGASKEFANPYVQIPIVSGIGEARNAIIVRTADAAIAINGGYGTLSEIAYCLSFGVPVIGIQTWAVDEGIWQVATAEAAVDLALTLTDKPKL